MQYSSESNSIEHLLTLCHSYPEDGFIIENTSINFTLSAQSLFMHSIDVKSGPEKKEFMCEVFNVRNPLNEEISGHMIHFWNRNTFRVFFVNGYIGKVIKFFIMFQKDQLQNTDKSKNYAIFQEDLS
jgi:hypothetical protein